MEPCLELIKKIEEHEISHSSNILIKKLKNKFMKITFYWLSYPIYCADFVFYLLITN